jgi:hypothetical protein
VGEEAFLLWEIHVMVSIKMIDHFFIEDIDILIEGSFESVRDPVIVHPKNEIEVILEMQGKLVEVIRDQSSFFPNHRQDVLINGSPGRIEEGWLGS